MSKAKIIGRPLLTQSREINLSGGRTIAVIAATGNSFCSGTLGPEQVSGAKRFARELGLQSRRRQLPGYASFRFSGIRAACLTPNRPVHRKRRFATRRCNVTCDYCVTSEGRDSTNCSTACKRSAISLSPAALATLSAERILFLRPRLISGTLSTSIS